MKERPILFSGDMVKAILDERKTMTRRVIKPQPASVAAFQDGLPTEAYYGGWPKGGYAKNLICPYGQPGDRLWVKETWRVGSWREDDGQIAVDFKADGFPHQKWRTVPDPDKFNDLWEESTLEAEAAYGVKERYKWAPGKSPCRWRSPIFMPRWASRITLEITSVRVERVQDISEMDTYAEGRSLDKTMDPVTRPGAAWFHALWDSLNAKSGHGWDVNDWVWVNSFKRVQR